MKRRAILTLTSIVLLTTLVVAYNNCGPILFSTKNLSTSTGNPKNPAQSEEIAFAICSVLDRCQSQVPFNTCMNGVLATNGIGASLGLPAGEYDPYSSVESAESSNQIVANQVSANTCIDAINNLSCSNPAVQAAYDSTQANPFAGTPNMIPATSCNQVFVPQALPELVQSASGFANTTNLNIVLPVSATGSGNLLVVGVTSESAPQITGISDNASGGGNLWINTNYHSVDNINGTQAWIWYAKNSLAGATSVTVSWTGTDSGVVNVWMAEFSGMDLSSPLDTGAVTNSQPKSTTGLAPQINTSSPFEVVFSIIATSSVLSLSGGNLFTALPIVTGDNLAYEITSSVGSYGAQWSQFSSTSCSSTVAFKAAQQ